MIPFLLAQIDVAGSAGPDLVPSFWRMLGSLAIVLSLLGALVWLLRRGRFARRTGQSLGVESALPLGERRSLVIVTVEGRRLLVGLAPGTVSLVTELAAAPAPISAALPPSFDQALTRATGQEARS